MPLSLAQYAMEEKQPLRKGIMLGIAQEGIVTDILPWRNLNAMSETGVRYDQVSLPAYIPLGGSIEEGSVQGKQIQYSTYRMAKHLDVPVPLEDQSGDLITRPSVQQIKLLMRGAAYLANTQFVNGDQAVTPDGFDGVRVLVSNMDSRQVVAPSAQIDFSAGYTTAKTYGLVNLLNTLADTVDGHKPDAYFANTWFIRQFESCIMQEKLLGLDYNWKESALDIDDPRVTQNTASRKPAYMWRDTPVYDLGYEADQETYTIGNSYTHATGSGETEVYAVKINEDNLEGIQSDPLNVREIGLLQTSDTYRWRLTWTHGLAAWGPRSIALMTGIKLNGAVPV